MCVGLEYFVSHYWKVAFWKKLVQVIDCVQVCGCFGAVKGKTLLKMCPYLGIVLQGIPACSEYLEVGGASRAMQREPPTACSPPVLPLPKSRAYEWPEYNKRHFFLLSLPLASPSLPL